MRVKRIEVMNLQALSRMEADLNGCTAIVTGGNDKGKSSFLKSLPERIRGNKPDMIVKKGETAGRAEWALTDGSRFVWEFDLKTKKGEKLTLVTKENIQAPITKEIAKRYFPPSFDIDVFLNSTPKKQSEILQKLVGLDFSTIDARYKHAYKERTRLNTIAKHEKARLEPIDESLPQEPVDTDELGSRLSEAIQHNDNVSQSLNQKRNHQEHIDKDERDIERLEAQISELREHIKQERDAIRKVDTWLADNPTIDVEAQQSQYKSATDLNIRIRKNQEAKKASREAAKAMETAQKADEAVKAIEAERRQTIKAAKMPEDFSFGNDGILYKGLPLDKAQISSSGIYIAALKLAAMTLGEVRVLHFDASFLDKNNLAKIETWARENDLQLLIERPDFDGGEIQYELRGPAVSKKSLHTEI